MTTSSPAAGTAPLTELRRIMIVAVVDLVLLVPLVVGVIVGYHELSPVLGPLHGAGFLLEVFLAVRGAAQGWWGWWFPAVIVVTTGPPGAFLGHRRAQREARAAGGRERAAAAG